MRKSVFGLLTYLVCLSYMPSASHSQDFPMHALPLDYSVAHYDCIVRNDSLYIATFYRFNGDMYLYYFDGQELRTVRHWNVRSSLPSRTGSNVFELTPQLELLVDTHDSFSLLDMQSELERRVIDTLECPNEFRKYPEGVYAGEESSYFVYHDYCFEKWVWAIDNSLRRYNHYRVVEVTDDQLSGPVTVQEGQIDCRSFSGVVHRDTLYATWQEVKTEGGSVKAIMFATFADGALCEPWVVAENKEFDWPGPVPLGICKTGGKTYVFWFTFDPEATNPYFYSSTMDYEYWRQPRSLDASVVDRLRSFDSFRPSGPSAVQSDDFGLQMLIKDKRNEGVAELFSFDGKHWENRGKVIDEIHRDEKLVRKGDDLLAFWLAKVPRETSVEESGNREDLLPMYEIHYSVIPLASSGQ